MTSATTCAAARPSLAAIQLSPPSALRKTPRFVPTYTAWDAPRSSATLSTAQPPPYRATMFVLTARQWPPPSVLLYIPTPFVAPYKVLASSVGTTIWKGPASVNRLQVSPPSVLRSAPPPVAA